jgi:hypothetical protein
VSGGVESEIDVEFRRQGAELARQISGAIPRWVEREVARLFDAWVEAAGTAGTTADAAVERSAVLAAAAAAGRLAAAAAGPALDSLLTADVDSQGVTPLQIVRKLVGVPAAVLEAAGVPSLVRDCFARERFPADPSGLTPASLGALDPALTEASMAWGAAKAMSHKARHGGPRA